MTSYQNIKLTDALEELRARYALMKLMAWLMAIGWVATVAVVIF